MQTFPIAQLNTSINVQTNGNTWAALVFARSNITISTLLCYVTQTASPGVVQGGIYSQSTLALLGTTNTASTATTGVKTLGFTSPVALQAGQFYYLAITAPTANGSLFAGWVNAATLISTTPVPAVSSAGSLPATLTASATASVIWLMAF